MAGLLLLQATGTWGMNVGDVVVRVDKKYFRPAEVETLLGDASYAKELLGWEPIVQLQDLCKEMMESDLRFTRGLAKP